MGSKESATIQKFIIYSHDDPSKFVDVSGGNPTLEYRESVFDYTIRITGGIIDAGSTASADDGSKALIGTIEYLNLRGAEKVEFKMKDAVGNVLDFEDSLRLGSEVLQKKNIKNSSFGFELISKEIYDNANVENAVYRRYNGKISDSINQILTQDLKTERTLYIDPTLNTYPDFGKARPPFDVILELQQMSIPDLQNAKGNTAGYYFWQTSKGYHFQSPDSLLSKTKYKKYLYDFKAKLDTDPTPPGYDDKIIDWQIRRVVKTESQLDYGAIGGTITKTFNPSNFEFSESELLAKDADKVIAGSEIPTYGEYSDMVTSFVLSDVSVGNAWANDDSIEKQQEKSKEENYSVSEVIPQAMQNYRQKVDKIAEAVIPGDFSLHAGDIIWCEVPEDSTKETARRSGRDSGIYMILELCHKITTTTTTTHLLLGRDSFGVR